MSRLNSSIFSLKLKAKNRNVKKNKIDKILNFLYHETDHTEKLRQMIHKTYLSEEFLIFFSNPEQARQGLMATNPKKDLKDEDTWEKTKQLLSKIHPGELNPNTQELEELVSEIEWRSGGLNKKEMVLLKEVLIKLYDQNQDRFPNETDLIEELKIIQFPEAILKKLETASFSVLFMPSSVDFYVDEEQAEKVFFDSISELKKRGNVNIEAQNLEFILNSPKMKQALDNLLKDEDYVSEVSSYSGNLKISLKIHKVNELMKNQDQGKNKYQELKGLIISEISSGREVNLFAKTLRREYGMESIKRLPEMLKELNELKPLIVRWEEKTGVSDLDYVLTVVPKEVNEVEMEFIKTMRDFKL